MKAKYRAILAFLLALVILSGHTHGLASGETVYVTQNLSDDYDSWQLSSLDQTNLAFDTSYTYPASAGLGVTIYDLCEQTYSFDTRYRAAKNANRVSNESGCFWSYISPDNRVSRFVSGVDFVIDDKSNDDRKILVVNDYLGEVKNYPAVANALTKAELAGILVVTNGYKDSTTCQGHSTLTVGGYNKYSPEIKSDGLSCIDIFAPEPNDRVWPEIVTLGPLNYVAEVAANYLSLNLSASVQETRNAILSNGNREYFNLSTCVACQNKSLDQEFLLNDDPGYQANVVASVTDHEGHPMRETDYTHEIKNSSGSTVTPNDTKWFKCDLGCYQIDTGQKLTWPWESANWSSITGDYINAVSNFTLPSGRIYYVVSRLEKSIVENPISFPSALEVGESIFQSQGKSGLWYLCSTSGNLPSNQQPVGCKLISPVSSNSIKLLSSFLDKYLRVRLDGNTIYFSQTSNAITKTQPELELSGVTDKFINGFAKIRMIVYPGNKPCPRIGKLTVFERRPSTKKTINLELKSCRGTHIQKIRANTVLKFEIPETKSSYSAAASKRIYGTPELKVQSPVRTFGKYTVRVKSNRALYVTCNVTEDLLSFEGTQISSRYYKLKLTKGSGARTSAPNYIGVIKGLVMCPKSSDYGDSYGAYKIFSY